MELDHGFEVSQHVLWTCNIEMVLDNVQIQACSLKIHMVLLSFQLKQVFYRVGELKQVFLGQTYNFNQFGMKGVIYNYYNFLF